MKRSELIRNILGEVGYKEGPNNDNKYGKWFGLNHQPWCCILQIWNIYLCGGANLVKKTASCGSLYSWAMAKGYLTNNPLPGDLMIMTFTKSKPHAHTGLVIGRDNSGAVICVEGNTAPDSKGSQDNGDGVYIKKRPLRYIHSIIRLPFREEYITVRNTRQITVWTAPGKKDEYRSRVIDPQTITVCKTLIPSITSEGDTFYRTMKGAYVLSKYCKEV